ncbi:NERD domain-containing protein [Deinococcus sp. KNUC1210]|uniref:DEAD/DEAH box helicase n=1 Tax=Deinococcus sp. KNUC1210 TaxID=2917691 RepID=UPI001EF0AED2|nr:nuclease-related domain-containing DEAD/DEAH box helicase [Deinococcus sp. KNUC1210]ULH16661.1 NERD domain-containing protein [Deinococcus sp. KNUC1210]
MAEFIVTESVGAAGEAGELRVIDGLRTALRKRSSVCFWKYPLNTRQQHLHEPDVLLLDPEWGIVIIEVKNIPMTQLAGIQGYSWRLHQPYFGRSEINPYEQARRQAQAVIERIRDHPHLNTVPVRALVALPRITRDEWERGGSTFLFSDTPILCGDELTPVAFERKVERTPTIRRGQPLDDETFRQLLSAFGTGGSLPVPPVEVPPVTAPAPLRKIDILAQAALQRREFDLQQELIAKTIPPGAQRIRGIAGSGKTVLLAQKAANMHLRHPDWDIALVFFCRALYEQMQAQVDHWLRAHSNGAVTYLDARHKIRILHAWGSKDQPGFYRTVAQHAGLEPMNVADVKAANGGRSASPTAGVLLSARDLLRAAEEQQLDLEIFDAVLIDEGQDLVDERLDLKYDERQAFYWLAYRSLRPVEGEVVLLGEPELAPRAARRIIWAYDEAQSLDTLAVPKARELFGDELAQLLTGGTQYRGGIKKNEVMKRCYRTPGPILVAAHALGMGLLRPGGMVAGLTRREGWQDIGYDVEGELLSGRTVTIRRSAENSPNIVPRLYSGPLLTCQDYATRRGELSALAQNVQHALEVDGLSLDRQLVICLGQYSERAMQVTYDALRTAGLDVYVAGNLRGNTPPATDWREQNRNGFRLPGHVTVTNVVRAKGNEADLVHIVGLDEVGHQEGLVSLRNQLFVALSRSRGWVSLSGTQTPAAFRDEVQAVLSAGEQITFTMSQPRRNLNDELEGAALPA